MATTDTTEVVLRDGTAVQVTPDFAARFPALAPSEEMLDLLDANLGDQDVQLGNFKRIKVPSGDSNSWMVNELGEEVAKKSLKGVLVTWKARRSYWINEGNPDGSQPDCYSLNNKTPVSIGLYHPTGPNGAQNPTGMCANCPMSQRGSSSRGGQGAACREQRLLFLVMEGGLFPVIVHVPRTSIGNLTEFMLDLMQAGKRFDQVEVELTLVKDKNREGQVYNKVVARVSRTLEAGEQQAARLYGGQIKDMVDAAMTDFTPAEGGGISVGEPADA